MCEVTLRQVSKSFGAVAALRDVSLTVRDKEFVVFVGPSGCGKSTLLRLIAGLEDIDSGDLVMAGERSNDRSPRERGIAMVFQSYALYPHMTVFENMAFGLELARLGRAAIAAKVRQAAESLQLTPLLDRLPRELSGGQRQRVAIGRAIVREPRVFLFDEPLSNLDAALRVQTRLEIARLRAALGVTTIYVTHDQVEAMTLADRIVVLNRGRVEQVGAPLDLYHRPANLFVAGFIGSPPMNFIAATVTAADRTGVRLALPGGHVVDAAIDGAGLRPGEAVTLGIRPEHLRLEAGPAPSLAVAVEAVEALGECHFLHLRDRAGQRLTLRGSGATRLRPGDHVAACLPDGSCHLFAADGTALPRLADQAGPMLTELR